MSNGKVMLGVTIGVVAVVVKLVHDMQVEEKREMKGGVERDKARRLEKHRQRIASMKLKEQQERSAPPPSSTSSS